MLSLFQLDQERNILLKSFLFSFGNHKDIHQNRSCPCNPVHFSLFLDNIISINFIYRSIEREKAKMSPLVTLTFRIFQNLILATALLYRIGSWIASPLSFVTDFPCCPLLVQIASKIESRNKITENFSIQNITESQYVIYDQIGNTP